ncbi:MAG: aminotransferase class I/II-fold pyridoxal phosphate-dependent enzyme [Catenulispora sp.]|nr:aminotransferase class I/II-fold pyridoxal phosphate-dependent enzyme [Catenulispora sp.]
MDQFQTPILDALDRFRERREVSFSPPGHRQGRGAGVRATEVLGPQVFAADVVASELDSRQDEGASLKAAERLMADAVGAEHAFFSTCGSSLSVKAAMLAVANPGEPLLIGRDVHKSVASGLVLSGVVPVWVDPSWDRHRNLAHPPSPEAYAERLAAEPDARGALVTSPTPYGTCADIRTIVELCHARGLPVIVDEAWGAHLPFHDELPSWAMDVGADVCVTSVHKMGGGLEQGSVFHLQGDLVDPAKLASRAELLSTTSPSVLLYGAMDAWRQQMMARGKDLLDGALETADHVRREVELIDGLHVNGRSEFCGPGKAHDLDPLQVVIEVQELGITGYQAANWLEEHHRIGMHLADHRRISAQLSFADQPRDIERLLTALRDLSAAAGGLDPGPAVDVPDPAELRLTQAMLPREAYFAPFDTVPAAEAAGRISTEILTPYPPGIPAALPGERLDQAVIDYLRTGVRAGMVVPDATDKKIETLRVVRED